MNLVKLVENKEKAKSDYNKKIEECKAYLGELEQKALDVFGQMENCENMINALEEKFNTKNQEVENLKVLIKQMKDDLEKIKGEVLSSPLYFIFLLQKQFYYSQLKDFLLLFELSLQEDLLLKYKLNLVFQ